MSDGIYEKIRSMAKIGDGNAMVAYAILELVPRVESMNRHFYNIALAQKGMSNAREDLARSESRTNELSKQICDIGIALEELKRDYFGQQRQASRNATREAKRQISTDCIIDGRTLHDGAYEPNTSDYT